MNQKLFQDCLYQIVNILITNREHPCLLPGRSRLSHKLLQDSLFNREHPYNQSWTFLSSTKTFKIELKITSRLSLSNREHFYNQSWTSLKLTKIRKLSQIKLKFNQKQANKIKLNQKQEHNLSNTHNLNIHFLLHVMVSSPCKIG